MRPEPGAHRAYLSVAGVPVRAAGAQHVQRLPPLRRRGDRPLPGLHVLQARLLAAGRRHRHLRALPAPRHHLPPLQQVDAAQTGQFIAFYKLYKIQTIGSV